MMSTLIKISRKEYKSRFKELEFLGKGLTSMVCLCKDTLHNTLLVCKYVDLTKTNSYYKEHIILDALKDTQYVTEFIEAYSVDRDDEKIRIHMVYKPNMVDLYHLIFNNKLCYSKLIDVLIMISKGIRNSHEKNVIHRDIKLENILVEIKNSQVESIEIIDWGFSCFIDDEIDKISGSLQYISKELLEDSDVGPYNDIWSLGVLFYCAFSKLFPFKGNNYKEIFNSIRHTKPDLLEITNFKMRILIDQMLKDVEDRISIDEVITFLTEIKDNMSF